MEVFYYSSSSGTADLYWISPSNATGDAPPGANASGNLTPEAVYPEWRPPVPPPSRTPGVGSDVYARALELLLGNLSPEQRQEFEERECFTVVGQSGRSYRIRLGAIRNVWLLSPEGITGVSFCIAPTGQVPPPDVMLAQKLLLQTDEEEFLRVANRFA